MPDCSQSRRAFFPCNVCALDELDVESMTWIWPGSDRYALSFCLVHTPADLARGFRWLDWMRWLFWNPVRLERLR